MKNTKSQINAIELLLSTWNAELHYGCETEWVMGQAAEVIRQQKDRIDYLEQQLQAEGINE